MNRHLQTEQLSAYLDSELGVAESRELESHFKACAECGARLRSMRRVLDGLAKVERAALPPELAQSIRRQTAARSPRRIDVPKSGWRSLFFLPLQPALRTSFAMGLAFVMSVFLVSHGIESEQRMNLIEGVTNAEIPEREVVEVYFGDSPRPWPETTSEVAGREFIWNDEVWVQRGLEGKEPSAHVDARSPEGRRLLTKYSDLGDLLADGSRVVLRYNTETVELRNDRNRVLGFESETQPRRRADPRVVAT